MLLGLSLCDAGRRNKRRGSWRSGALSPVRVQVGRLSTRAKMGARPFKQLGNYMGHYAALGNNLRAAGRPRASQGGRPSSEICGKI